MDDWLRPDARAILMEGRHRPTSIFSRIELVDRTQPRMHVPKR